MLVEGVIVLEDYIFLANLIKGIVIKKNLVQITEDIENNLDIEDKEKIIDKD